ncbi:hypothetical protein ACFVH6_14105 [Spirillospora sp. NPDC127200]
MTPVVPAAYGDLMGRTILTIIGVVLALWLAITALGWLFSLVKFFFFIGLVAVVIYLVVTLVAKGTKKN